MKSTSLMVLGLLLIASFVNASEQEAAKAECEKAIAKYAQQLPEENRSAVAGTCDYNVRPVVYWQCTNKHLDKGETFDYATSQCEDIDPS